MSIEIIQNLGDDALSNLFEIQIGPFPTITDLDSTRLRVQNFTIPATGVTTYTVDYKTQTFTKPAGKIDAPNEFTFDFRIDRSFSIYKGFVQWKNLVANSSTGAVSADTLRVPITVWPINADDTPIDGVGAWNFKGCFCQNVGEVSFVYSNTGPIIVTVTMGYLLMDDNTL